ncbi:Uncharacterised protein [Chryseobacterium nakagawai]|uniref:Uncharacterized protein n=1 Tax=Chryseobacterium nakagawai TaxID=1241982 RepID=A0AAD0YKH5_CHRNA|nr:hypothetical protein [Chryseobacterium nakagawai]AZA90945.1 hypothetical protein EG343_10005 [Chryseobacterium nakagawai]VEH22484.1 Uncharacterised protein [Chryseobacterium nakagawai]
MAILDKFPDISKALKELERRKEMAIWQLSIAIDKDIVQKKQYRIKELDHQIKELQNTKAK